MKDLKENIERMEKELADMKAKLEDGKKFEWEYPYGNSYALNNVYINDLSSGGNSKLLKHGRYRLSKEYAEHSLERNRVANRLEALVEQIEPDYIVPDVGKYAHFIYIDKSGIYGNMSDFYVRIVGQVSMGEETATKICELLNSGEVVL